MTDSPHALPLVASSGVLGFVAGDRVEAAVVAVALAIVSHLLLPLLLRLALRALAPSADLIGARVRGYLARGAATATALQSAPERSTAPHGAAAPERDPPSA